MSKDTADSFILKDFSCCLTERLNEFDLLFRASPLDGMSLIRSHAKLFGFKKKKNLFCGVDSF